MEEYKKDRKIGIITFILGLVFMMAACHVTAQHDRREKIGEYWFSWSLQAYPNTEDTLNLFAVSHFNPYDFYCLGIKLNGKEKTIGSSTMVLYYENGLMDYVGSFFSDGFNTDGYAYYPLREYELNHIKTLKIKYLEIINPTLQKKYLIDMQNSFASTWYQGVLKQ